MFDVDEVTKAIGNGVLENGKYIPPMRVKLTEEQLEELAELVANKINKK